MPVASHNNLSLKGFLHKKLNAQVKKFLNLHLPPLLHVKPHNLQNIQIHQLSYFTSSLSVCDLKASSSHITQCQFGP